METIEEIYFEEEGREPTVVERFHAGFVALFDVFIGYIKAGELLAFEQHRVENERVLGPSAYNAAIAIAKTEDDPEEAARKLEAQFPNAMQTGLCDYN